MFQAQIDCLQDIGSIDMERGLWIMFKDGVSALRICRPSTDAVQGVGRLLTDWLDEQGHNIKVRCDETGVALRPGALVIMEVTLHLLSEDRGCYTDDRVRPHSSLLPLRTTYTLPDL